MEFILAWISSNSLRSAFSFSKISTREIDQILSEYSESVLSGVLFESRVDQGFRQLYVHLPDKTLAYEGAASATVEEPVWFVLSSGLTETSQYRGQNLVWAYNKWYVGDPQSNKIGVLNFKNSSHWGTEVAWEFLTEIVYNNGDGAIFHEMELVCLTGRSETGIKSKVFTSWSTDGMVWSQEIGCRTGNIGNRNNRISWVRQGMMRNWRVQRVRGTSNSHTSFIRLEARIEPLSL